VLGKVALDNRMRQVVKIEHLANRFSYQLKTISGTQPGDEWRSIEGLAD